MRYCYRCERSFNKEHALDQHIRDSSRHHECPECDYDGETWDELLDHCRDTDCRSVCRGCNNGQGSHWVYECQGYLVHLEDKNVCDVCEGHYESPANLYQHKLSHRSKSVECYRCYEKFKTYGGMIIHLERGSCDSDVDKLGLDATAAECHMWPHFIYKDYQEDMLDGYDLTVLYRTKVFPYKCPTCGTAFPKLSSLFQHIESSACNQTLNDGSVSRLRRFLESRYKL